MLKFFRNIRQQLLTKNQSTSRYLLYAIGEIILVVIGILIALKINDWHEKNKFKDQEHLYLIKIQEDIQIITDYMMYNIQEAPRMIEESQLALYAVQYCELDSVSKTILEKTLVTAGNLGTIYIRDNTFSEMVSNGSFSKMKNDSLKNHIGNLYSQLDYLNESIHYFQSELGVANQIIWDYVEKGFKPELTKRTLSDQHITVPIEDQITVKYDFKELCNSAKFKNALVEVVDSRKDVYQSAVFVYENLNSTLEMLNSEIQAFD